MTFASGLLPLLRCRSCGGEFAFAGAAAQRLGRAEFGVLHCGCGTYPVVDGVPILQRTPIGVFEHTTGAAQSAAVMPDEVTRLITAGRTDQALVACLASSPPTRWRVWRRWQEAWRLSRFLRGRDAVTAREALRFFSGGNRLGADVGEYFVHRFAQPRFLAALSVLSGVDLGSAPLLDIACGVGHVEHYLTRRARPAGVVGLDMNFDHVWLARHWIAPAGLYVCGNVAHGLPFRDGAFGAVLISDAYHYLHDRDRLLEETARVAPARRLILTRVGNREVMPNEGREDTLSGYLAELGPGACRVYSEPRLVRQYLARVNPLAGPGEDAAELERQKWLTFVRGYDDAAAPSPGGWPHVHGHPALNPIYAWGRVADGLRLEFGFPSTWFAYENNQMLEYHPRWVRVSQAALDTIAAGRWDESLEDLARRFVVLGLPERY